jgi:hypothetical protein
VGGFRNKNTDAASGGKAQKVGRKCKGVSAFFNHLFFAF